MVSESGCDFVVGGCLMSVVSLAGWHTGHPELTRTPALLAGVTWQSLWQLRQEKLLEEEDSNKVDNNKVHDTPVRVVHLLGMQVALGWLYHAVVTDHANQALDPGIVTDVVWIMAWVYVSLHVCPDFKWGMISLLVPVAMIVLQALDHFVLEYHTLDRYRYLYRSSSSSEPTTHRPPHALPVSICLTVSLVSMAGCLLQKKNADGLRWATVLLVVGAGIYPAVNCSYGDETTVPGTVAYTKCNAIVAGLGSLTALWLVRPIGVQFTKALVKGHYTQEWDQLTLAAVIVLAVAAGAAAPGTGGPGGPVDPVLSGDPAAPGPSAPTDTGSSSSQEPLIIQYTMR